jgi:hypothetical protein
MEDPTKVQVATKSRGLRPTQNYIKPTKCPAQIRVKRNTDGSYLIVKFDEQHDGHELNKELYDNLPRNKRLNLEEKEVVINMMDNGADACMVAEFMRNNSNKQVRSRDRWQVVSLRNLQLKKTDPENQNNLLQQTINRIIDQDNGNYFSFLYDNTPEKNLLMIFRT